MYTEEDIIGYDFQGWPIYKMTLSEILLSLGAIEKDGFIGFPKNTEILNAYPIRLRDDGMGYGVDKEFFIETNVVDNSLVTIFTEREWPKEELESRRQEREELNKMLYDRRQLETNSE